MTGDSETRPRIEWTLPLEEVPLLLSVLLAAPALHRSPEDRALIDDWVDEVESLAEVARAYERGRRRSAERTRAAR